jgi:hypothetical protein
MRRACEIRLRAERRAGQFLAKMKTTGERQSGGKPSTETRVPTLDKLGIKPDQSSQWQKLGAMPRRDFDVALGTKEMPTTKGILRSAGAGVIAKAPPAIGLAAVTDDARPGPWRSRAARSIHPTPPEPAGMPHGGERRRRPVGSGCVADRRRPARAAVLQGAAEPIRQRLAPTIRLSRSAEASMRPKYEASAYPVLTRMDMPARMWLWHSGLSRRST